jgi:four helix bundle protein
MAGLQDLDDCKIEGLKEFDWSWIQSTDFLSFPDGTVCARCDVMNQKAEELKARTKQFALDVLAFVKTLPKTPEGEVVRRQLVKAATGVMANYRSSCRARSHTEFTARIGVVLEEADEAEGWLETIRDGKMSTCDDLPRLYLESVQLRAIFFASTMTARRREQELDTRSKSSRGAKKVTRMGCVLFVCAGNTCRSVIAEYVGRRLLSGLVDTASAGIRPQKPEDTAEACFALRRLGFNVAVHRPRGVNECEPLDSYAAVVAMDDSVAKEFRRLWPSRKDLITWTIADPWGGGDGAYEKCANEIAIKIHELKRRLLNS